MRLILVFIIFCSCSQIESPNFVITLTDLGQDEVRIIRHFGKDLGQVIWLNVHEDEQTSIEALWKFTNNRDIRFTYLSQNGNRRLDFEEGGNWSVDPNRIYTSDGIKATLGEENSPGMDVSMAVVHFANEVIKEIEGKEWVITVHNNTENNYGIQSYLPDSSESKCTERLYINDKMDPDDFVYTTVPVIFDKLKDQGINVILQQNECTDDGSLSVYCGKYGTKYINIETQHGHLLEQLELMEIIARILEE